MSIATLLLIIYSVFITIALVLYIAFSRREYNTQEKELDWLDEEVNKWRDSSNKWKDRYYSVLGRTPDSYKRNDLSGKPPKNSRP